MLKKTILFFFLSFLLTMTHNVLAQKKWHADKKLQKEFRNEFVAADSQYHILMHNRPADKFPKTFFPVTGQYEFSNSNWWCSGFYPGSLLFLYEKTKDTGLYHESMRVLSNLEKEQFNKGTHDLGFMMYCSFGNANRVAPSDQYKTILLNSAKSLSTRFNPTVGCIRSWNSTPGDFIVIIDNMMNLELLFWATKVTGDSSYYKIAVTHANTTMRNHFRGDYSSYHVIDYDSATGLVKEKRTAQGAANESAWARGQAWGLYGYTMVYRETRDQRYLDQANHIARFILDNRNLPADKIPYWDFNAPGIPNALRDASAAAIIASALLELSSYTDAKSRTEYLVTAEKILRVLNGSVYKAARGSNGGFLLQHGVGHLPNKSEVDVPLSYADYYFIEAMKRYCAY